MNKTHGKYGTPTHKSWAAMLQRARGHVHTTRYADRGIGVCERWASFEDFYADMGDRPDGTTLDRIDNDRDYEPGNCRWATRGQQARNKSTNTNITANGVTLCITDWAARLGIKSHTIRGRVRRGWTPEKALSTEMHKRTKEHA